MSMVNRAMITLHKVRGIEAEDIILGTEDPAANRPGNGSDRKL